MSSAPITISLQYFALLREQTGCQQEQIKTEATTPRHVYQELAARYPLTLPVERIGVAINNNFSGLDAALKDGDSLTFIPPVAGG